MEKQESSTTTMYPVVTAIDKCDDEIGGGKNLVWGAANKTQTEFLPIFVGTREEARGLKEIRSISSRNAAVINKFLADDGYSIQLEPFKRPTDFGTASILDVTVEWLETGRVAQIVSARDGVTTYPGVFLKPGVSFGLSPEHPNPIAVINTKSGDRVCMTIHDRAESLALLERADELSKSMQPIYDYKGVYFPQVDLDQKVDISWLVGFSTKGADGYDYEIAQALQQTKFRMNEKGARAQSAVAVGVRMITSVQPYIPPLYIDKPFLVWIERAGLKYPLFTGWINEENWKTPKDISIK